MAAGLSLVVTPAQDDRVLQKGPAQELLDLFIESARIKPRIAPREGRDVLASLALAVGELASGARSRCVVHIQAEPEPWELALERSGDAILATLFQGGGIPEVALFERRIDVRAAIERALGALEAQGDLEEDARLALAVQAIERGRTPVSAPFLEPTTVAIEPTGELPISISAEVALRVGADSAVTEAVVHRADLASLLFRGKLRLTVGGAQRELADVFVFLVAEQLVSVALDALDAWSRGRPSYRRLTVGGAICGVRLTSDGAASLTLGVPRQGSDHRSQPWTFPAIDVSTLVQGVVAFGRALTRSLVRRDRAQSSNLRLLAFRAKTRELTERLREITRNDAKINDSPESYRAFAAVTRPSVVAPDFGKTRLRFTPRWFAAVPSIDLRATFLCGDRIVLGQTREITCLDRKGGEILWQRPSTRATSVMTPLGLARIDAEGTLALHELERGEIAWTTRLAPRVGSGASGVVVSAPGLPRMLIVSEGARHLAAVDLHAGEIKWRFAARRKGNFRLRRAGKLLVVASGDPALTALDVLTGEIVWRFCDRLRFASHVAVDHDALFAVAGDGALVARGGTRLHHLDPWSGVQRWSIDLPASSAPVGAPLIAEDTVVVVTSGRGGTSLLGFDRRTGELLFERVACSSAASCLLVDGAVIVNSEGGELCAIDAKDGSSRYRHVFACGAEGDRPRRLEPVLRSGALFVPQSEVHVVRPSDGTLLGRVPNEIVPDLLRVDERCDVYVAEESGHVAAYAAAARLSLVT